MIFSGVLAAAFLYFIVAILHVGWPVYLFFAGTFAVGMIFHNKKHFRTAQITFVFLYLVIMMLWAKGAVQLTYQFVYLLGAASVFFTLSDILWEFVFRILSWTFVGIAIALLMYERFGSLPISIIVGLIVIPIALRDRGYEKDSGYEKDKGKSS